MLQSVELSDQMMIVNNATDNIFTTFSMRVDVVSCLTTSLYCLSLRTCLMKKIYGNNEAESLAYSSASVRTLL